VDQQRRLSIVLGLNLGLVAGLVVVGAASNSFGVLAAAGDFLADSLGLALGIIAIGIARRPGGHANATTYVALVNSVALLVVTVLAIGGGLHRLLSGTPEIRGLPVFLVSVAATVLMTAGALILGREPAGDDLHIRSVMLDTVADALSAAVVAASGATIYLAGGLDWLDSAAAVVIGSIIGVAALRLMRDVVGALRRGVPLPVADRDDESH
jgi:cobalt-zinc-cadmium efflux system protein